MDPVRILSTKLLPDNLVNRLLDYNIECVQHNFIEIKPLPFNSDLIDIGPNNWIITSKNAWAILVDKIKPAILQKKTIFCVGEKTKKQIQESGYSVFLVSKNSKSLAKTIVENYSEKSFQYFSGDQRMSYLPNLFQKRNIDWYENVVYSTIMTSRKIDEPLDALLFYSPSGITSYFENNLYHDEVCFCIGNTTSISIENYTDKIIIAEDQTFESVIDSVIKHYS